MGIAVGALSVALLVALAVSGFAWISYRQLFRSLSHGPRIVAITPVETGEPWFTTSNGTGTLDGWPNGSCWGDDSGYFFDIYEVGVYEKLPIRHVVAVDVDDRTEFYIGDEEYKAAASTPCSA